MRIRLCTRKDRQAWDDYVSRHPQSTVYHLCGWERVIREAYGHNTYYLLAVDAKSFDDRSDGFEKIMGVFPLVHVKSFLFGNSLVSMPFLDRGGTLADSTEIEQILLQEAIQIGSELGVGEIELRQLTPISVVNSGFKTKNQEPRTKNCSQTTKQKQPVFTAMESAPSLTKPPCSSACPTTPISS